MKSRKHYIAVNELQSISAHSVSGIRRAVREAGWDHAMIYDVTDMTCGQIEDLIGNSGIYYRPRKKVSDD